MTLPNVGSSFAKVAKSIDNKLGFLPTFPRKIIFSTICIIGIPFLFVTVLLLRNWHTETSTNNKNYKNNLIEDNKSSVMLDNCEWITDDFHAAGPEGEGYYSNGFRMPENTDEDWL
ncbi:hypothetical protein EV697_101486 [Bisgaardia hudsonensis]|uniref:Uncharacterized protein n=1 Tax=Bisgaardia hudsonensis TaxID=109472 RepID=A0A4R2N3E0_9PAST|nr:hypothetical protein [Bisgaardia hudsonensis]QLB12791.1 hypothetical protein A6A11_03805 [Bisgaardia hudsonensis]TCP14345.1 hypothetical protein EV697_101486 [Bisgaardia hudsonensis]